MPDNSSESESSEKGGRGRKDFRSSIVKPTNPPLPEPLADCESVPEIPQDPQVPLSEGKGKKRAREEGETDVEGEEKRFKFSFSKEESKKFRKIMAEGIENGEVKDIRARYTPSFETRSVLFQCPSLDDSLFQRLRLVKNSTASKSSIDTIEKNLYNVQLKILDVARPLLFLLKEKSPIPSSHEAVIDTLFMLGESFHEVTKQRRRNILRQTSPSFLYLLDNPDNFNIEESNLLFGRYFIQAMVKESETQAKLGTFSRSDGVPYRSGGHSYRDGGLSFRESGPSYRGGGHSRSGPSSSFDRQFQPGPSGFDPNHSNSAKDTDSPHQNNVFSSRGGYVPIYYIDCSIKIGGRLRFFVNAWTKVSQDPWILDLVKHGLSLEFHSTPFQNEHRANMHMNENQKSICSKEVNDLLAKGAVRLVSSVGFISPLFVIPKKAGGFRPIINLKFLNEFITYHHFKMENISLVKHLLSPGDWMVKLDLKDAYLTVPIHPSFQHFLQFIWEEDLFQFTCLPFGLSSAPWVFTKLLRPVVTLLRSRGIRLIIYLDDILVFNSCKSKLLDHMVVVKSLIESLGFVINLEKSVQIPSQSLEFLGLMIDTPSFSLSIPKAQRSNIFSVCEKLLKEKLVSLRDLASILGKLNWASIAIPYAQAHYRNLQSLYITNSRKEKSDLQFKLELSAEAKQDLDWWMSTLTSCSGEPIKESLPTLTINADASLSGWGAVCNGVSTGGPWSRQESSLHINVLELRAAFLALRSFADSLKNSTIALLLDNVSAVCYINRLGGTRSKFLAIEAAQISKWCEDRGIILHASHLPGSFNIIADRESRRGPDWSDWMLDKSMFQLIADKWEVKTDLFASVWNAQLRSFISWKPQPGAQAIDALSLNWTNLKGYAFPPFCLIKNCVAKIVEEETEIVLVVPYWPSQPWFPALLSLACEKPLVFLPCPNLLLSCKGEPHPLCQTKSLTLTAWRLSGKTSENGVFQNRWSGFCWPAHASQLSQAISQHGQPGLVGVNPRSSTPWIIA